MEVTNQPAFQEFEEGIEKLRAFKEEVERVILESAVKNDAKKKAYVEELERTAARIQEKINSYVYFLQLLTKPVEQNGVFVQGTYAGNLAGENVFLKEKNNDLEKENSDLKKKLSSLKIELCIALHGHGKTHEVLQRTGTIPDEMLKC